MTIAISLKVNDGLVLAADSASTLSEPQGVVNVYNHANKIFNLRKGLPIGAITWGSGGIGTSSISTLIKDLRRRFNGAEPDYHDWELDPENYSVAEVANRLKDFIYGEQYLSATADWPEDEEKPPLGFVVAGYSSGEALAEEYQFTIEGGELIDQEMREKAESGVTWNGQPEAITRLIFGMGRDMPLALEEDLGVPTDQIIPALEVLKQRLSIDLVHAAMPFGDAIDLAEFLVDLTVNFSRFIPGAPTVGGPIEIAAISKHEGFKWIKRKHYFNSELNPPIEEKKP
jgi:hypothetical protein